MHHYMLCQTRFVTPIKTHGHSPDPFQTLGCPTSSFPSSSPCFWKQGSSKYWLLLLTSWLQFLGNLRSARRWLPHCFLWCGRLHLVCVDKRLWKGRILRILSLGHRSRAWGGDFFRRKAWRVKFPWPCLCLLRRIFYFAKSLGCQC